jgi:UDP-N-acetylmuramate--alanine ligase
MKDAVTFSLANHARYMPRDIVYRPLDTDFSLDGQRFTLSLPGQYNLSNAIACVAILSETGITLKEIAEVLHEFNGIERRFDIHLDDGIHLVVDDYAHNPHKISALMHAAQPLRERICYIFQPHGFGPTRMMKDE